MDTRGKKNKTVGMLRSSRKQIKDPYHISEDVLDRIFTFLPIKQATQMGILSSRFKETWASCRKLHFDLHFARSHNSTDFMRIVDRIFSLHSGPKIQSFGLCGGPFNLEQKLGSWIKICIDKGVEELDFNFFGVPLQISFEFIDIETLKILKLDFCEVDLPPKLKGLSFLSTLVYRNMNIASSMLDTLFNHCLNLEYVEIDSCYTFHHLKLVARNQKKFKTFKVDQCREINTIDIDAPTLQSLYYSGQIITINLCHAPIKLNDVMINFVHSTTFTSHFHVEKFVHRICNIVNVLTINVTFLEGLCKRIVSGRFGEIALCFQQLKEFQLIMEGANICSVYDIASFLRKCPGLEKLFIDLNEFSFYYGLYWELHQRYLMKTYSETFNFLRFIKIKGFKFQKHDLEFVRFLLQKAIILETLVLVTSKKNHAKAAQDELIYFPLICSWKVSPNTQIVIYDHSKDGSSIHPKHRHISN